MSKRETVQQQLQTAKSDLMDLPIQHLFAMWSIAQFHYRGQFDQSSVDEIYEQSYGLLEEGGPGDSCLDGYFYDEDASTIYLYQAKWPETERTLTINDARELASALAILHTQMEDGNLALGELRQRAVDAFSDVVKRNGKVVLRGVTGGTWGKDHKQRVIEALPSMGKVEVVVELHDINSIFSFLAQQANDLSGVSCDFPVYENTPDPILRYPGGRHGALGESLVILLSALGVSRVAGSFGDRLFERNVRFYLGSGRVNKDMAATIDTAEGRESFWYGHNGITILCDGFDIDDADQRPKVIRVTNPQVVNGCQTATTLAKVLDSGDRNVADFPILARVIRLEGELKAKEDAAELIAFRTNNQTSVNPADLAANDELQKLLQQKLRQYQQPWFYERKKGEWAKERRSPKSARRYRGNPERVIDRELYQQAWRAFTGSPSAAISSKGDIWHRTHGQGKDLYELVFDRERKPEHAILAAVLFDWFRQVFKVTQGGDSLCFFIFPGLRMQSAKIRGATTLVTAHSVALVGHCIEKAFGDVESYPADCASRLIASFDRGRFVQKNWSEARWKTVEMLVRTIMNTWANYCVQRRENEQTVYASLKRPHEIAFKELADIFDGLAPATHRELAKPD